jgi:hypothetical protein
MTFQHGGHGCLGVGGILGAFGIHLPKHDGPTLQERINDHHERVTQHVQDHHNNVRDRINDVRDSIHNSLSGGGGGLGPGGPDPGESAWMMGGHPLNLLFGDPTAAVTHHYSLAAIPVGGGVTMSIVALIAVIVLTLIMASMVFKGVATRAVPMASAMVRGVVAKRGAVRCSD